MPRVPVLVCRTSGGSHRIHRVPTAAATLRKEMGKKRGRGGKKKWGRVEGKEREREDREEGMSQWSSYRGYFPQRGRIWCWR